MTGDAEANWSETGALQIGERNHWVMHWALAPLV